MNQIYNTQNEKLDTLIEGDGAVSVIMAHGIGTDKHETDGLFDEIAKSLVEINYRVIRFDFSGFGKSEGRSVDFDLEKGGQDLQSVINWTKENYLGDIYLLSQSMATAITCLLQPSGIKKTVFTAHVNPNPNDLVTGLQNRMKGRPGAVINERGITIYPRSSGAVQKFGPTLWQTLRQLDYQKKIALFSDMTDLLVIRPNQDEIVVVDNEKLNVFRNQTHFKYEEIDGDHSFRGAGVRENLINMIKNHFNIE